MLRDLITALHASRGFAHKHDISTVLGALKSRLPGGLADMDQAVAVGDDCAAIPDGQGGHLLLAIEGLVADFVTALPWFAGYSGVMVNVSDVYAMGGRPIAVVDALWSGDDAQATQVLAGMADAAARYGVPLVGGHSNLRAEGGQLAVAILGRAQALLSSFNARPGDVLLAAVDLRGAYMDPYPFWNASTPAPAERLRADLELLPALAEAGLCDTAKDISMAGVLGTALMLLECSAVGAELSLDTLPRPAGLRDDDPAGWLRWLCAFPSYGFLLSVRPEHAAAVQARFAARDLACAPLGRVTAGAAVQLRWKGETAPFWDFDHRPFITAAPRAVAASTPSMTEVTHG